MRKMKNSGIEWIGEIPENWERAQLKNLANVYSGHEVNVEIDKNDNSIEVYGSSGVFKYTDEYMYEGDAVLFGRKGNIGKPILIKNKKIWVVDTMYYCVCNKYLLCNYLYYFLTIFPWNIFTTKTALPSIVASQVFGEMIVRPPIDEQQKIADYLDKRCENIDGLVELQNRMIEKLKEYKQSVITEVVTKGLDPAAKMKNSGVEWIGEIPENWEVKRLKNCGEFCSNGVDKKIYPDLPTYKAIHYINVYKNKLGILNDDSNYLIISCTNEKADLTRLQKGDIIITNSSETPDDIGVAAYVNDIDKNTLLGYHLMRFRPLHNINSKFMLYCLNSKYVNAYFASVSNGITRYSLLGDDIKSLCFCCPPIDEQQKIADYLDAKCAEIDRLIEIKQKKIEKLQDYKKSLIYECVTGKREVS